MIYKSLHAISCQAILSFCFYRPKRYFLSFILSLKAAKKGRSLFGNVPNKALFMWAKNLPKTHPVREKSRILHAKFPL